MLVKMKVVYISGTGAWGHRNINHIKHFVNKDLATVIQIVIAIMKMFVKFVSSESSQIIHTQNQQI